MRRLPIALVLSTAIALAGPPPAAADPRMETNNNFCHFIMDPARTDNEVFAAECNSAIVTTELPPAGTATGECLRAVARGYGERTELLPEIVLRLPPGSTLTFTSAQSDAACTMVESNGRAYRSHNWRSSIRVEATDRQGMVLVRYALLCLNGRP